MAEEKSGKGREHIKENYTPTTAQKNYKPATEKVTNNYTPTTSQGAPQSPPIPKKK